MTEIHCEENRRKEVKLVNFTWFRTVGRSSIEPGQRFPKVPKGQGAWGPGREPSWPQDGTNLQQSGTSLWLASTSPGLAVTLSHITMML